MNPQHLFAPPHPRFASRRDFLRHCGNGFGLIGLAGLLEREGLAATTNSASSSTTNSTGPGRGPNPLAPHAPHFPTKARSVIWLFMNGGPSQVDTWDYKPELERRDGQELAGFDKNTGFFTDQVGPLMKSPFKFSQRGQSGAWVSELFPNLGEHVDRMAFIHSCWTESNNHSPALFMINTGMARMGFPCVGSWVTYGLGSESQDLPAFVVMYDTLNRGLPKGQALNWGAGFLPSVFQGTALKPQGLPIDDLVRPTDLTDDEQRAQLDLVRQLNRRRLSPSAADSELAARVESFELAYRMQMDATDAFDISREPQHIRDLYGDTTHGRQMLIARRLVERGVRFVQLWHGEGQPWDNHDDIAVNHRRLAEQADQPIAALLKDLKQRGMLDDVLVIWGGQFGRTPSVELPQAGANAGKINGRDHNHYGFTMWLAGGGCNAGTVYGATDDFGFKSVVNPVHVHDLHATIMKLLGFDHEKFTFRYAGRDFRLTDVHGKVVDQLIA